MYRFDDESPDDQQKAIFAAKYTQLLLALTQNYEVLFITEHNSQWA
jgi:hypothetical protein